jgi:hypothetical protein
MDSEEVALFRRFKELLDVVHLDSERERVIAEYAEIKPEADRIAARL